MDIVEQLQKLQALRNEGALTEEEFARAKQRVIDSAATSASGQTARAPVSERAVSGLNSLQRSWSDRWIAGVAGGLAQQTNIPTWAWRILFVLTTFLHGVGLLMYILMWIFVPLERPKLAAPAPVVPAAGDDRIEPK